MPGTSERAGSSDSIAPRLRSSRAIVVLVLILCYAALFYAVVRTRASRSSADGPAMFSAVVSDSGERRAGMSSKPFEHVEDQTADPPRHWIFPAIDIWPSPPGWSATLSEFTPVTNAQPDPAEQKDSLAIRNPSARRPVLHMLRWLRPDYPTEWALAGKEGTVLLDIRIDPAGQAAEIRVTRSSGLPELDESAVHAAHRWRFAPPLWNTQPVEVWAQVELRYHRSGDRE